jgi:hypothetical protein
VAQLYAQAPSIHFSRLLRHAWANVYSTNIVSAYTYGFVSLNLNYKHLKWTDVSSRLKYLLIIKVMGGHRELFPFEYSSNLVEQISPGVADRFS